MRTEEEAKYDLDQSIFEMYDSGVPVKEIAQKLSITAEYIISILEAAPVETS